MIPVRKDSAMAKKIIVKVEKTIVAGKEYYSVSDACRMINNEDVAYAAGIIDGEGSIVIGKGKQHVGTGYSYEVLVSVHMMDGYVPKYLAQCFGGKYKKTPVAHNNKKGDFAYYYHANGSRAKVFLSMILPYLKIKRRQAEIAIYLQDKLSSNPNGKLVTPEMAKEREALKNMIQELKRIPVNEREVDI